MTKEQKEILMIKYSGEIAYKFTTWDIDPLEQLRDCQTFILRLKVIDGQKLTKDEQYYITDGVNHNSYSKKGIPLKGWMFDFSQVLNNYIVKQYGQWTEYNATDKTSLRNMLTGKIEKIIINNK